MSAKTTEHDALVEALSTAREYLRESLEGLDDDFLRRPVLPSGWTCLGLVNHLALDPERLWFQAVIAGNKDAISKVLANSDNAWIVQLDVPVASVLGRYRQNNDGGDEVGALD